MDSPTPVSQSFIHEDLKFVPNNFMALLHKLTYSEGFHMVQDFLASCLLGYAPIQPTQISAKSVQQIWNNSIIADDGDIVFIHAENTFVITQDVIVKALKLHEGLSTNILYTENEMKGFLVQIGYNGDIQRMGRLVMTKLRKEWNFFFDCICRCFTNKCANYDSLNHLVQNIGYSLIHNAKFDIASNIYEYLGLRLGEGKNVYFARFVDLIFKYLCPDIVFENDSYLLVFQPNPRVFRDMIGTENKLQAGENVPFITHVRHLLKVRIPIVYGSPPRAMVQKNEEENPPESNPSSKTKQTVTLTSDKSQNVSVVKSKRVAKSDGASKSSGLRPSSHLTKQKHGEKRAATTLPQTQTNIKRRNYVAADSSSNSDNVVLSVKFPNIRAKSKDIFNATVSDYCPDAYPDTTTSTNTQAEIVKSANPDDMMITGEELQTTSHIVVDTGS